MKPWDLDQPWFWITAVSFGFTIAAVLVAIVLLITR